jgi:branched-chain amino acid aminotransferase
MPDELSKADEVFVTGTAAEVTPVGQIADMKFTVGPVTKTLLEDYDRLVREPVDATA